MIGRDITQVIDRLIEVAPDLSRCLNSIRESSMYVAPEMERGLWVRLCKTLNDHAVDHPKRDKLAAIMMGTEEVPAK